MGFEPDVEDVDNLYGDNVLLLVFLILLLIWMVVIVVTVFCHMLMMFMLILMMMTLILGMNELHTPPLYLVPLPDRYGSFDGDVSVVDAESESDFGSLPMASTAESLETVVSSVLPMVLSPQRNVAYDFFNILERLLMFGYNDLSLV